MEGVASILLLASKADLDDKRCKAEDQESQPVRDNHCYLKLDYLSIISYPTRAREIIVN